MFEFPKGKVKISRMISVTRKAIQSLEQQLLQEAKKDLPPQELHEIQDDFRHEIRIEQETLDYLKTQSFLSKNDKLPVAVPERNEDEGYWDKQYLTGRWALTDKGFEHLDERFHAAIMRRNQRFQIWFTPLVAIVALVVSIISLATSSRPSNSANHISETSSLSRSIAVEAAVVEFPSENGGDVGVQLEEPAK